MKNKLIYFITILVVSLITGCTNDDTYTKINLESASVEMDAILENMVIINQNELENVYEVDTKLLDEYIFKITDNNNGDMYLIVLPKTGNKIKVKEQIDNLFEKILIMNQAYSPESVQKIENRLETFIGDYLIYIVSDDNQALYNIIKNNISE